MIDRICLRAKSKRRLRMGSPAEELEGVALSLPRGERDRLAERLLASLDEDSEVEEAWALEVSHRLEAYRKGTVEETPADEVLREARSRLESQ
jgi:putative addiction module component (TIGR02574 family)